MEALSLIGHLVHAQDSLDTFFQMLTHKEIDRREIGIKFKDRQSIHPSIYLVSDAPLPTPLFLSRLGSLDHPFFQNPRCVITHETMEHVWTTGRINPQICPSSLK